MTEGYARGVAMLESCGISVPGWRLVGDAAQLRDAVAQLRGPFVVKSLPELAHHKTEQGLVHLRLRDHDEVQGAAADVWAKLSGTPLLVQEMVDDIVEVLLAVRVDPDFGPIAAIGTGGVAVELHDDVAYLALPAAPDEFRRALRGLKLARLLGGFRGQEPRDIDALALAASRLGDYFIRECGTFSEVEINPLGVRRRGEGVIALDLLEVLAAEPIETRDLSA